MHLLLCILLFLCSFLDAKDNLQITYTPTGKIDTICNEHGDFFRHFEYDAQDRLIAGSTLGTRFERSYSPEGYLLEERWNNGLYVQREYDEAGHLIALLLPHGERIDYTYLGGVLHAISYGSHTHYLGPYDAEGRLLGEELPDSLGTVQRRYNPLGCEVELITPYLTQTCTYNAQRYLLSALTENEAHQFTYDAVGQLTSDEYAFDELHRLLQADVSADGQVLAIDDLVCNYDEQGRLISKKSPAGSISFHYDAMLELIRVDTDKYHFTYVYDALGRRIAKVKSSKAPKGLVMNREDFLYDDLWEIASYDRKGNQQALRVFMLNNPLKPIMLSQAGHLFYPIVDQKGSTLCLVDLQGKAHFPDTLSPFGRTSQPLLHPWAYHGQRFDPETQLYYFGKRYYDPALLTWTTPDPVGTFDSPNLYQFLHNNPFYYTDLDGQSSAVIQGLFGLIAEAAGCAAQAALDLVVTGLTVNKVTEKVEEPAVEAPPYDGKELGEDPTKCPGEGFVWRGSGPPSSGKGSWVHEQTRESLHPDLNHPLPKKPHWDYERPSGEKARLNTDGTWEWK